MSFRYRASDIGLGVAIAAMVLLVAWQAYVFAPPFELMRAWQLRWLGLYFPGFSVLLALVLVALLGSGAIWLAQRGEGARLSPEARALAGARRLYLILALVTAGLGVALIVALAPLMRLPADDKAPTRVDARAPGLGQGPAVLVGRLVPGKAFVFDRALGPSRRQAQLVAVAPGADGKIRYLVELPQGVTRDNRLEHRGLLVPNALPSDALMAFEEAGQPVARPYAVLFLTSASASWASSTFVVQLALLTLVALVATIFQYQVARRLAAPPRMPASGIG